MYEELSSQQTERLQMTVNLLTVVGAIPAFVFGILGLQIIGYTTDPFSPATAGLIVTGTLLTGLVIVQLLRYWR